MLVLSRKVGESIHIGDEIEITILNISSNRIRIGFRAPEDIDILRSELCDWSMTPTESSSIDRSDVGQTGEPVFPGTGISAAEIECAT